jgi:hypothetical protein
MADSLVRTLKQCIEDIVPKKVLVNRTVILDKPWMKDIEIRREREIW